MLLLCSIHPRPYYVYALPPQLNTNDAALLVRTYTVGYVDTGCATVLYTCIRLVLAEQSQLRQLITIITAVTLVVTEALQDIRAKLNAQSSCQRKSVKTGFWTRRISVITAEIIDLLLLFIILFKSSGRALLFRGGDVTVTTLLVRFLFLIRTSRDYITRPLDASTLDILDLLLLGSSSFLSFVLLNKRQFNYDFQSLFIYL